ncbi:hypothetical protein [Cryptosporangium phraense]|uniref:Uncharacterized protein n=1 Tax=Cryptosporangium phraense TaxID=2593070 RepID=A0A545AN47_9ACTN|nr:hypothetical protein [Cryptosporangium phraense]TQS42759.1 hypothetical protein FL583_22095 [Cryptosporangium phraense]
MWDAWAQAGETSNYQSPALARYATGSALTTLVDALKTNSQKQRYFRGRPTLHAAVTELSLQSDPATASIRDCAESGNWRTVDANGRTVSENAGRRKILATVAVTAGVWKVSTFNVQPGGSC